MRHIFVILLVFLVVTSPMASQTIISKGVKAGINYATIGRTDDLSLHSSITQFAMGVFVEVKLPFNFSVEPEILYIVKGAVDNNPQVIPRGTNGLSIVSTLRYVEIPVLLKYSFFLPGLKLSIYGAPSAAFLLNANFRTEWAGGSTQYDVTNQTSSIDLGLLFGAGVSIPTSLVDATVDLRYDFALTELAKEGGLNQHNRSFAILLGVAF